MKKGIFVIAVLASLSGLLTGCMMEEDYGYRYHNRYPDGDGYYHDRGDYNRDHDGYNRDHDNYHRDHDDNRK